MQHHRLVFQRNRPRRWLHTEALVLGFRNSFIARDAQRCSGLIMPRSRVACQRIVLWLCASLGLLSGLWAHDLLAGMMAERMFAAIAYRYAGTAMQPPRPLQIAQRSDEGLLDVCGWVPLDGQYDWLRVETNGPTFLGVGVGLPAIYRGSDVYEGVDLTKVGRSRWFDHLARASAGGAALYVSLAIGALIAAGRNARWPIFGFGTLAAAASIRRVFMAFLLAAVIPPVLFYFGYNRLHLGTYGLGSFAPPAWALWPALVFVGVLAGWAWTRCSIAAIGANWEHRMCPARCPSCGYAWSARVCSECGSPWTPELLRRTRVRSSRRAAVALVLVAIATIAAPQLSPLVLAHGSASVKAQFLARWLTLRPTNYSVVDEQFLP